MEGYGGTCIKTGNDEIHFNVSLIMRDKITGQCPQNNFGRERRAEAESNRGPSAYQPNALPLGQTGSHTDSPVLGPIYFPRTINMGT